MVANDNPLNALITVSSSSLWDTSVFASELVLDLVGLVVLRIDRTDQAVFYFKSFNESQ